MKKYLLVLVAMLLVVTGCGGKKLTCTMTEDDQSAKVVVEFGKNDEAEKINMTTSTPIPEGSTADEIKEAESYMQMVCSLMNYEGMTCEVKSNSKTIDIVIGMDMTKMDDATKEEMGYSAEAATYDAMKKDLEADGYSCK